MQKADAARIDRAAASHVSTRPLVSGSGVLLGCALFAASLTPSLVPRDAVMQGIVGGTVFAVGYGGAVVLLWLWRWVGLREPDKRHTAPWATAAAAVGVALIAYGLWRAPHWQNAVREVMDLPRVESSHTLVVIGIAAVTALVLFFLAWLLKLLMRGVAGLLRPHVPPRLAILAGLLTAFAVFWALLDGVLVRYTYSVLDASYSQLDRLVQTDEGAPAEPWRTGSGQSYVPWSSLGRDGRNFLTDLTLREEVAEFWSAPAEQPLRIYVGLNSADSSEARAALALKELERVGAFEREVLVVAVPTGTGFMDERAVETLEYLHKGDVATVAIQYSYLQSPFSLIFESEYGSTTARELLRTVYAYWSELPEDARPRLYLYGLSLGALNSERSLRLREMIGDPIDGALWAGPPFLSPIHSEVTRYRNPGTPEWLPRFEDGSFVRFMNQWETTDADAQWGPLRILYLQHASDPIVFFGFPSLWRRPDWLAKPRAPDVTDAMRWFPVVTGLQLAADMALSTNVPRGYGHEYAATRYVDAWVTLTTPDVSEENIERLKARLSE
jgi:uncharacterized membrane protein